MTNNVDQLPQILEAAIFAAGEPINLSRLEQLFAEDNRPERDAIKQALETLHEKYIGSGVELMHTGSGYRFQSRAEFAPYLQRLWEKKPPRYSRALLETLAIIVYKQPLTRGEIEDVRGVAVSTDIVKKLMERNWIKVLGQKDVPGKPSLYGTTKAFLDYFNLQSLTELPPLQAMADLEQVEKQLTMNLEGKVEDAIAAELIGGGVASVSSDDVADSVADEESEHTAENVDSDELISGKEISDTTEGEESEHTSENIDSDELISSDEMSDNVASEELEHTAENVDSEELISNEEIVSLEAVSEDSDTEKLVSSEEVSEALESANSEQAHAVLDSEELVLTEDVSETSEEPTTSGALNDSDVEDIIKELNVADEKQSEPEIV